MSGTDEGIARVSTLELFFDLVFVFTITQLTDVLVHHLTWEGFAQVVLMLGVIWWMYGGYAWLTNAVSTDRTGRRLLLLGGMGGYLVLALAIPGAFGGSGTAFGVAYVVIVAVHGILFTRASSAGIGRSLMTLAPFNGVTALLVLAGGVAGGAAQYVLWAAAVGLEWISPRLIDDSGFLIAPAHFVERHGLVVIVAIGESVVAIGIGASGLPVDAGLVVVALLGLMVSACLWWTYFGGDDERAERALAGAPPAARPRMAVDAFGALHLPMLLGIVVLATGLKNVIAHSGDTLHAGPALALAGGAAMFMAGDVLFRRRLRIGTAGWRMAAAALALATVPLGLAVSAAAQLAALLVVLAGALALEAYRAPPAPATAGE